MHHLMGYLVIPPEIADLLGWTSEDFKDYDIPVHGGCTFAHRFNGFGLTGMPDDSMTIGWDYNHYGDDQKGFLVSDVESDIRRFAGHVVRMAESNGSVRERRSDKM